MRRDDDAAAFVVLAPVGATKSPAEAWTTLLLPVALPLVLLPLPITDRASVANNA